MPRILALDIGTSSVRATVYTAALRPARPGAHVRYTWRIGADGSVELPAGRLERLVESAIDRALSECPGRIDAVAIAAFWHSLVGVDRSGKAITAVLPWTDTRARAEAVALQQVVDEADVHRRTGCRLHPTYWPARLRWFKSHDPRTFARVARWMSFPAYLEQRWLGRDIESVSQASGTGFFTHARLGWDADLCRACGVSPDQFGRIADTSYAEAALTTRIATRWPALRNARWIPAVGDGAVNNLGAGCVNGSRAALMIGTSGALRLAWTAEAAPNVPLALWRYWLDGQRVVVGGALSNGGNFVAWVRDTFGVAMNPRLDARLARLRPDGHGLTVLPFLAGERSPDYQADASAVIAGLRLATTREDVLRAGLEAIGYRFLAVMNALCEVRPVAEIVATGTALVSSPVWIQVLSDVLGRPIAVLREPELTSRGAALLGCEQMGIEPRGSKLTAARIVRPDPRAHDVYRAAAERQRALAGALTGKFL